MHSFDSSSGGTYKMLDTQSSSATAEDITNLFKNKLRRQGFKFHEVEYMTKNGFKKLDRSRRRFYPFH